MNTIEKVRRLLLPAALLLFLANPVRAACDHDYVQFCKEPTCDKDGFLWTECRYCGHTTSYDVIPALGHTFDEWIVLTAPTCTREGLEVSNCLVCGHQQSAPIPSLGHGYEGDVKPSTCTAGGYTRYNCRSCSSYYISDYTAPLGHQYDDGVLIKEPTETAMGRVRFTCIRCAETYQMTYTFRDINSNAYYFSPVLWAVNKGITSGMDETHFVPDAVCNRAQVVTFLWRAAGKPEPESMGNPFVDVPTGSFYEKAVIWAYQSGITTGTDATHFSPESPCNRAQVVTFLHRFRGCPEATDITSFPDVSIGSFYHKAVLWAAQRQITVGMDGGYFHPELPCSRAQIVTFLYRDAKNP